MQNIKTVVSACLVAAIVAALINVNSAKAASVDWIKWHEIVSEQAITEDRIRGWKSVPSAARNKVVRELNQLEKQQAKLLHEGRISSPVIWHKISHKHDQLEDLIRSWKSVPSVQRNAIVKALNQHQLDVARIRGRS